MIVIRACLPLLMVAPHAALLTSTSASAEIRYYVDPVDGNEAPAGGCQAQPWRTVAYAVNRITLLPPESQAGLVLNLRANALYAPMGLPSTLHGTPAQPLVIQPYDGDRVVFDGGEPRFRQPGAWEPVPGQADEWQTVDPFTTLSGHRVSWGQMMDTKLRLITYANIEDLRAANESYATVRASDPRPDSKPARRAATSASRPDGNSREAGPSSTMQMPSAAAATRSRSHPMATTI